MAAHNRLLGKFDLVGIPAAPRGIPQVEVTFDIDANGILKVSAKDLGTGKEQQIRIESSSGLSESEIQKMVKEAESHAEQDKKEREKIDIKNQADQLVYQTEKTLSDLGDKISADDKTKIQAAVADLKEKIKSGDSDAMKSSMDALMKASHHMAEEMYKHTQGSAGAAGGGDAGQQSQEQGRQRSRPSGEGGGQSGGKEGKGPVDADFEVLDDDEKKK